MIGFSGFFHHTLQESPGDDYIKTKLYDMSVPLCRVDDTPGIALNAEHFGIISPDSYHLCMGDRCCYIAIDGDIFNQSAIKELLKPRGFKASDISLSELILVGFMEYGIDFIRNLYGNFSIAIFDARHEILYLFRDHFGSKPLYYSIQENCILFSSEIKSLFTYSDKRPIVSREGLNELFGIGPAHTPGKTLYDGIHEVKPGCCLCVNRYGHCSTPYWSLPCLAHFENYEKTVRHTADLLSEIIHEQLALDPDPCCLLSGGIDSSIVSAYLAKEMKERGQRLITVSFDFSQNDKYFKASSFQPSQDRPYVDAMVKFLGSEHHYLECNEQTLADMLNASVISHDAPCMADVDSSLLFFCGKVKEIKNVAYTGECADEIFGGYPWFHRDDMINAETFPWAPEITPRKQLLKKEFLEFLNMDDYMKETYHSAIRKINVLPDESITDAKKRRNTCLTLYWFMQTLLKRMDCCGRSTGLTARIPFADIRLAEYVYNAPWSMKARNGLVKSLLRQSAEYLLPRQILLRKKSPFPKTYNPYYEKMLSDLLSKVMEDSASPLHNFLDKEALSQFLSNPKDYGAPWYGQLMCGPQMIAYLLQIDFWIREYQIDLRI
ncbi:MAG: asparagine synthase (glutamine-hydrolyzing) [Lachnospiraceae bacterium]|nr:asparagine synthase (glutamine-hydrolyzing) [Lachnospiraceae bacterium]